MSDGLQDASAFGIVYPIYITLENEIYQKVTYTIHIVAFEIKEDVIQEEEED